MALLGVLRIESCFNVDQVDRLRGEKTLGTSKNTLLMSLDIDLEDDVLLGRELLRNFIKAGAPNFDGIIAFIGTGHDPGHCPRRSEPSRLGPVREGHFVAL